MIRRFVFLAFFAILNLYCLAQPKNIRIEAGNEPLSEVLLRLRNDYKLQFSYSETQLQAYRVNVSASFNSPEKAINYLLKDLPFHLLERGDVYIIVPDRNLKKSEKVRPPSVLTGQIVEAESYEPLPFSSILINEQPIMADVAGTFNYS